MGRMANYPLTKEGVGVILKGRTRISVVDRKFFRERPYVMSYLSDIDLAMQTQQFWRSNPMMLDGTSITRTNADYYFPQEGALLYFYADQFTEFSPDTFLVIHTEIEEKGDGF